MSRSRLSVLALEDRTTPATLADGFALSVVTSGLTNPTSLVEVPDGRLLVTEQGGALRVVAADGTLIATPALQLSVDSSGERGLLGVALDPAFTTNNFVYLYHTVPAAGSTPVHNEISRYTLSGNTIDPATERVLYDLDPLSTATNHNGGALHFGTDGKLYAAAGENANPANSQSLTTDLGKILRLNPDGSIPADNPTVFADLSGTTAGKYRSVYAVGFRNPFTFGVNSQTGQIFVNDVGQSSFEEVDVLAAGANYGWNATEGDFTQSSFPNFTRPIVSYPHTASGTDGGFAIIGGAFYTPATSTFPAAYAGDYFYGDLVNGWIRSYDVATGTATLLASDITGLNLVDLDVSGDGSLLVLDRGNGGQVLKIQATVPPTLPPTVPPTLPMPVQPITLGSGTSPVVRTINAATGAEVRRIDLSAAGLTPPFTGETRVASGDVTGDGIADIIVGSGPGGLPRVVIFDGGTGVLISSATVFESTFTGGVFVAAGDLDGDGKAEVIVSPDQGGGPRVRVFRDGDASVVLADFFGIDDVNFRGGARVTAGDLTGDGRADLVVAAGFQGGPRVAGFEGASVAAGSPVKMFNDFFAFESTLRNGVFVALGDVNADGKADLIAGGGPGGGPRVLVLSGAALTGNVQTPLANFFAGDVNSRNGVRVSVTDVDGDANDDLVVGTAGGVTGQVLVYQGNGLTATGTPTAFKTYTAFDDTFTGGVFVG
ncbi:PQQ-dependent sugar dehydrogenase [Limnoglobus roseus]|uniref:Putative glucose/L-sorbosone dehydrogenase, distantly related to bacterial beta-galactosidase n=1 Tax=Limnoglobus roseus TaxID=2598579 RepID=A0A5C1A3R2_9BACT|nr:PQQ-dependent sugar dehydrogenase [Limnoglobus roseus]QEL13230.1 putative glucose/L-sorbosone dehydrogenase, distantly related to bacterial beta-galactosidase [Limnoglobus roseus]